MKIYIFNKNRFLIDMLKAYGKKRAYEEWKRYYSKPYAWTHDVHGKRAFFYKGELFVEYYVIEPSWCEVKEVKENVD